MPLATPIMKLTGWPVRDRGLVMDAAGPVLNILLGPDLTDEGWALHCERLASAIDERTADIKVAVFYHVEATYSRARVSMVTNVLKSREDHLRRTTACYVYCTSSAMARTAVRFVFTVMPPPYPNAIVRSVQHGYDFLARNIQNIDRAAYLEWHASLAAEAGIVVDKS